MKILFCLICLLFSEAAVSKAFEIPRSEVIEITEKSTSRVYSLFIKTPLSYRSNEDKTYPVIYLTDAPYAFQITSGATRFPMNSGAMEEAIIVGIAYSKGSRGQASRVRDYTPNKASSWKLETGNAKQHAEFIQNEVFTYIESHYRADAEQRTFVGNSLGGLFGAYLLLHHPDMFNNYIIGSPSVWFNDHTIPSMQGRTPLKHTKVYVAVGSLERPAYGEREDMVAGATQLAEKISAMKTDKLTLNFKIIEGAKHATAFPTTLIQGLDWVYGKQ